MISHTFPSVFDQYSRILILGSFPSVKSRQEGFYYGNPQNRFWRLMQELLNDHSPLNDISSKRAFLLKYHIALWDVIKSCDIEGSADASIRNVEVNDIPFLLNETNISLIVCNGKKAYGLYLRYIGKDDRLIYLPSTSPANAASNMESLIKQWSVILSHLSL